MPQYLIFFNQQWVGDHTEDWFNNRGPLARAVVAEMREAEVLVFAGGLVAAGIAVLRVGAPAVVKALRPAPRRAIDKVPI